MFKNKVAVITGAASGIGKVIAEEFQKNGAKIWAGIMLTAALLLILLFWFVLKEADSEPRPLTIEDVYSLSQKETIFWADLSPYAHGRDIGSGLSIHLYPINEHFYLMAGGGHSKNNTSDEPLSYVRLCYQSEKGSLVDSKEWIDILAGDVKEFYESHKKQ